MVHYRSCDDVTVYRKGKLIHGASCPGELLRAVSLVLSPQEIDSERCLPLARRVDTNAAPTYGNKLREHKHLGAECDTRLAASTNVGSLHYHRN